MCTATFFKDEQNRIIFTTNRDESAARPTAPPKIHTVGNLKLLFPQDQLAGGTWVAAGQNGLICCIMNGAKGEKPWLGTTAEKSRGQIVLDAFQYDNTEVFLADNTFDKVHPFTLLMIHPDKEMIDVVKWNGTQKWMETVPASLPHIWSAYTLYPAEQRHERAKMFQEWSKDSGHLEANKVWNLHQASKENNGLLLENSPAVNTVSTTQLILDHEKCMMTYFEVGSGKHADAELRRL